MSYYTEIKTELKNKHYILLALEELKKRLHGRWTETAEQFEIRLATALTELEQQDFYDIKIVNDELEKAKAELLTILG